MIFIGDIAVPKGIKPNTLNMPKAFNDNDVI